MTGVTRYIDGVPASSESSGPGSASSAGPGGGPGSASSAGPGGGPGAVGGVGEGGGSAGVSDGGSVGVLGGSYGRRPAALARRFGALLVDWILCLLIAGFVGTPKQDPWAAPAVLILEYAFFLGFIGQTPGMFTMRISCVSIRGGLIGVPRAILRGFLLILVVPALIMDADQRGLHDKAAGSVMVGQG